MEGVAASDTAAAATDTAAAAAATDTAAAAATDTATAPDAAASDVVHLLPSPMENPRFSTGVIA